MENNIIPIAAFKNNYAACLKKLKENNKTIVLTRYDKPIAIMLSVVEYNKLLRGCGYYSKQIDSGFKIKS